MGRAGAVLIRGRRWGPRCTEGGPPSHSSLVPALQACDGPPRGGPVPFPVCHCGLQAQARAGVLGIDREALRRQHVTPGNFRGLESSGGLGWKWGKGLSVAPAVGCAPGPAGERQPAASWARHPRAGPCLALSHPGRLHKPHTGLASIWPPRRAGRARGGRGRRPPCSRLPGCLRPGGPQARAWLPNARGPAAGARAGSGEPGRGAWAQGVGGCEPPPGAFRQLSVFPQPWAEAVRGETGTEWRGDLRHSPFQSFLPQLGLSALGHRVDGFEDRCHGNKNAKGSQLLGAGRKRRGHCCLRSAEATWLWGRLRAGRRCPLLCDTGRAAEPLGARVLLCKVAPMISALPPHGAALSRTDGTTDVGTKSRSLLPLGFPLGPFWGGAAVPRAPLPSGATAP